MSLLTDPGWVVPPLPPGNGGGMDRLRRAAVRFSTGAVHAARRADVEDVLATVSPDALQAAARAAVRRDPTPPVVPRVPLVVLASALGVDDPAAVAALVPPVAAAYLPAAPAGAAAAAVADGAAEELVGRVGVVRATLLVQSCLPVAALVTAALERGVDVADVLAGATLPVPATRRWSPVTGEVVTVPLAGIPFGEGPRRCPGEQHARALAAGVLAGLRSG